MISIIIPTLNEATLIEDLLTHLLTLTNPAGHEIIVSDGGSIDDTVSIAEKYVRVVHSEKGKSYQLNAGAKEARGDVLFFVHATMTVPPGVMEVIEDRIFIKGFDGGGFSNVFAEDKRDIWFIRVCMNSWIVDRDSRWNRVFYGDNGIFCKKEVFDLLGGFKPIPIMEDYEFSRRLRDQFRSVRITQPKLILSTRRLNTTGYIRTRLQWFAIKNLYLLGVPPEILSRWYRQVR